jgi:Leucine-rich repeat (LRR) protein
VPDEVRRTDTFELSKSEAPLVTSIVDLDRYDLSGPSITNIPLGATQETIIAALAEVEGLRNLNLGGTQMVDLHYIAKLDNVEHLILWDTYVVDLAPILGFDELLTLDIRGTGVSDLQPISASLGLTQLLASDTNVR